MMVAPNDEPSDFQIFVAGLAIGMLVVFVLGATLWGAYGVGPLGKPWWTEAIDARVGEYHHRTGRFQWRYLGKIQDDGRCNCDETVVDGISIVPEKARSNP